MPRGAKDADREVIFPAFPGVLLHQGRGDQEEAVLISVLGTEAGCRFEISQGVDDMGPVETHEGLAIPGVRRQAAVLGHEIGHPELPGDPGVEHLKLVQTIHHPVLPGECFSSISMATSAAVKALEVEPIWKMVC